MRRCLKCSAKSVVYLPQHRLALCKEHYLEWYLKRVEDTIKEFRMFDRTNRVLVAVSGGKDSLSLWDALLSLGYKMDGLYINLGIGHYSELSRKVCEEFAKSKKAVLHTVELEKDMASIPSLKEMEKRPVCSLCGQIKRYYLNRYARELGYEVIATGHNLDDETATLFSNTLSWQLEYLKRQYPVLSEGNGFVRKVKPLFKMSEKENALYAFLRGINFVEEECPFAEGASSVEYKRLLSQIEEKSPGTKLRFYTEFIRRVHPILKQEGGVPVGACSVCGEPTTSDVCSVCRLKARLSLGSSSSSPSS